MQRKTEKCVSAFRSFWGDYKPIITIGINRQKNKMQYNKKGEKTPIYDIMIIKQ